MLGVTERTFRRWSGRYHAERAEGLQDRRIGPLSARAVPVDEARRMLTWYETRYTGWTVKHFHERWQTEHGGTRSYSGTKKTLQVAGQVTRATRRSAHRKKRPRKPLPGMMLHQDGSTHEWIPGCQWDLIVTLDDATTEIYSAFFVEEEGTLRSVRGLQEVMKTKGLFSSLYPDRGSHSWHTDGAGGTVDQTRPTQVPRALPQVGGDAHSGVFAGGAGPLGACLPDPPGPVAQRAGAGRDHGDGGGQPVSDRAVPPAVQRPLYGAGDGTGYRLHPVGRHASRRNPVCARGAGRGQGQYGAVSGHEPADPARPTPVPLCESHGAGARLSGWDLGRGPWAPGPGVWRATMRMAD